MNLEQAAIVLRQRSLLELMDLSIRFVISVAPRTYLKLGLVLLVPALALALGAHWLLDWGWFAVWLVTLALGSIVQGVFTIAAGRLMFDARTPATAIIGQFARQLVNYVVTLLLSRIVIAAASVFIVTLPFAWLRLMYVHEAVLLEKAWPWEGMRRSSRFVAHHAKNAVGVLLALSSASLVAVAAAELLGHGIVAFVLQSGNPFGSLLDGGSAYALAGYFVSIPFAATARFLTYIDTRTRRDGWDIQIRFIAIESAEQERLA